MIRTSSRLPVSLYLPAIALAVIGFLSVTGTVFPAESAKTGLAVSGAVKNPLHLALSDLQSMPRKKIQTHDADGKETVFEGVALWDIIQKAGPILDGKGHRAAVNLCVVARAADGYQAVFALPEISPVFADREIILADRRDGQPLASPQGPLRIIVPGEKLQARWVRQVTTLEIVSLDKAPPK